MKKRNNKLLLYFLFFIILLVLFFLFRKKKEGFYTSDNITISITKLNEILNDNLEQLKIILTDLTNQKYQLSINEVINNLNNEYSKDSKITNPENVMADIYVKNQLKNLTILQTNINNINNSINTLFNTVKIENVNLDTGVTETYSLLAAINKLSDDIKKISSSLSQIPS
jgi:predicted PurR-regulated permease PerM